MPVPTQYSEAIFADYITTVLGEVATLLGWDEGSPQVQEAVADTLLEFGESTIGNITEPKDLRRLRALGRRAAWRAVVQARAGKYDFRDSDAGFTRSQTNSQAREMLKLAEADCLEFSPTYVVTMTRITRPNDPYIVLPDSERTIQMISDAELVILRADSLPAMPDTATILRATFTNGPGGQTPAWSVVGTTPCRLSASVLSGGNEQEAAAQLAGIMTYTLTVPAGTDINHKDRIQTGGLTFEVAAGKTVASWNISDSWTLTEIQR